MERSGHPAAFIRFGSDVDYQFVGLDKRTGIGICENLCAVESIHQIEGGKHHLPLCDGLVGFASDAEVDAETRPRMSFAILMYDVAESARTILQFRRINHLSCNAFFYLVPGTGGAIVVKEIITVHPVFRAIIFL